MFKRIESKIPFLKDERYKFEFHKKKEKKGQSNLRNEQGK